MHVERLSVYGVRLLLPDWYRICYILNENKIANRMDSET